MPTKAPTADKRCGTNAGHQAHRKRGEKSCDPCRKAHNAYVNSMRDLGQAEAYRVARIRVLGEFVRRYPDEYRELFELEYPRALAEQRAKRRGES